MDRNTLRQLIVRVGDYCQYHNIKDFSFCWHGGEPLLAGYLFYEDIIDFQTRYMPDVKVDNYIQTNGLLLNNRWINLFKKHKYYIAISMDGPKRINDLRRKLKNGRGTHDTLTDRIRLLADHDFPLRILSVITPEALPYGQEIYHYYRNLNCYWMDFLYPIGNWIDNTFDMKVDPEALGRFLCSVFDEWLKEDNPRVYIRTFHDWCLLLMGGKPITCHSRNDCSFVITINADGNVYICDDLLAYADSLLGDVESDDLLSIEKNDRLMMLSDSKSLFCGECVSCSYFPVCNGGCTLFRVKGIGNYQNRNFFCSTQKMIIAHIRNSILSRLPQ